MSGALDPLKRVARNLTRRRTPSVRSPADSSGDVPDASPPVDTDVGRLRFQAYDQLMLPFIRTHGRWESEEADQLRAWLRPGMTFVDIGAHVGYMTHLGARAVGPAGRVLAFEPAPGNVALLRENLAANGITNVEVFPAAASDRTGPVTLSLSPWNSGDNRAYPVPDMERLEVPAVRIDDVVATDAQVDVVKVDTQGTDHRALRGMERTLTRCRPSRVVEFWPPAIAEQGDDPLAVVEQYREMGFDVRVLGASPHTDPPSAQQVLDAAQTATSGFCSLILLPRT
jgi:FkbM family methyltransferase